MKAKLEHHLFPTPIKTHYDHIEKTIYSANCHKEIELLYIKSGNGEIYCNFEKIPVVEGDVVIINSNFVHCPASNTSMEIHCIIISSIFCETHGIFIENIKFLNKIHNNHLNELIKSVINEASYNDQYSVASLSAAALNLIVYLARNYSLSTIPITKKSRLQRIQDAIIYMQNHFAEDLTSSHVAQQINISESYFLHELKNATEHTFSSYLNNLRCSHAKNLLLNTNKTINQISELCGYENISYFSKTFKSIYSLSPLQYRKEHSRSDFKIFEPNQGMNGEL